MTLAQFTEPKLLVPRLLSNHRESAIIELSRRLESVGRIENVDDVRFTNCDVIHDKGREWTLRVYHCDSARISHVRFDRLRIEESPRLISLWIDKAFWTRDTERGHIDGVQFKRIAAKADPLRVELKGFDETHAVENVVFEDVVVNGRPLAATDVKTNAFVKAVTVRP